jgi:hypothetical protein
MRDVICTPIIGRMAPPDKVRPPCDFSHFTIGRNRRILRSTRIRLFLGVIRREEASMTTSPTYDREASRQLLAEAKAQRSCELRAAARDLSGAVRGNGVALLGVACLAVVGVAGCAG